MVVGSSYFGDTYEALCREAGAAPAVRMRPGERVLELPADRLKLDDWRRILHALSADYGLHYISVRVNRSYGHHTVAENTRSERAARNCKRTPALYTKFIMGCLSQSLATVLSHSRALTSLLLCRIPLKAEYLTIIVQGLAQNMSLQHLAVQHCLVGDEGTEAIAGVLQSKAALTTLELTDCGLTAKGVSHLVNLIKVHSHERYGECWKYSLRYAIVDKSDLPGLRRLTLNQNPAIGDDGLALIINALYDDMWIRAVDMQRCGLTEDGCREVARLVGVNKDLTVFDVRGNQISLETHRDILVRLEKNAVPGQSQFSWLEESVTPSISQMSLISSRPSTPGTINVKQRPPSPAKSTASMKTTVSDAPWHIAPKQRSRFTVARRNSALSLRAKKCRSAEQMQKALLSSRQSTVSERTMETTIEESEEEESGEITKSGSDTTRSEPNPSGQGDSRPRPPVVRTRSGGFKLRPPQPMAPKERLPSATPTPETASNESTSSELRKVESSIDLTKSRAKELFSKFLAARMAQPKNDCKGSSGDGSESTGHAERPGTAPHSQPYVLPSPKLFQTDSVEAIRGSDSTSRLTISRPPTPHPAHSSARIFASQLNQGECKMEANFNQTTSFEVRRSAEIRLDVAPSQRPRCGSLIQPHSRS